VARERIRSSRFGTLEVSADRIVHFVRPVIGFQHLERYAIVEDEESAPVLWMQALGAPDVLFPVADASLITGDYAIDLTDEEVGALGLERAEDARFLLILTLDPDPSAITVNLRAPIVWNTRGATAMQLVLNDAALSLTHPIRAVGGERRSNEEVARACSDPPQR